MSRDGEPLSVRSSPFILISAALVINVLHKISLDKRLSIDYLEMRLAFAN